MSHAKNLHEAERWLQAAQEDLRAVHVLADAGLYAQACFHAQQSAEKAMKALWRLIGADPWGHSVQRLVAEYPEHASLPDPEAWLRLGATLDKLYIPTRYPNGLPDLTPGQVFLSSDAAQALAAASTLVAGCCEWLESRKRRERAP